VKPMPADKLAALHAELDPRTSPASPEVALTAVRSHRAAAPLDATRPADRAAAAVPQLVRRLVDAETALATWRTVIVSVIAESQDGDEITAGDVLHRLHNAGIDIDAEVAEALELIHAKAAAQSLL